MEGRGGEGGLCNSVTNICLVIQGKPPRIKVKWAEGRSRDAGKMSKIEAMEMKFRESPSLILIYSRKSQ